MARNVIEEARRAGATVQNLLEVARFGGLETGEEPTPFTVADRGRIHRLRRYGDGDGARPPLLLVPPLMLTAEVYDVSPNASAVSVLLEHGTDPWVIDFGSPEREPGGVERNLADHVLAIDDAVDHITTATGRDVHLVGYSQGGMFCYQTAAYRRNAGVSSIVAFGSPVDLRSSLPPGVSEDVAERGAGVLQQVLGGRAVPGWATRTGFRLLDPIGTVRSQAQFLLALNDRDGLLPREGQRRFLMEEGWVAWPGPALADFLREFVQHNRMLRGGFEIAGRAVSLADLAVPILCVVGDVDDIAPPDAVRSFSRAAPRAELCELTLPTGHFYSPLQFVQDRHPQLHGSASSGAPNLRCIAITGDTGASNRSGWGHRHGCSFGGRMRRSSMACSPVSATVGPPFAGHQTPAYHS